MTNKMDQMELHNGKVYESFKRNEFLTHAVENFANSSKYGSIVEFFMSGKELREKCSPLDYGDLRYLFSTYNMVYTVYEDGLKGHDKLEVEKELE